MRLLKLLSVFRIGFYQMFGFTHAIYIQRPTGQAVVSVLHGRRRTSMETTEAAVSVLHGDVLAAVLGHLPMRSLAASSRGAPWSMSAGCCSGSASHTPCTAGLLLNYRYSGTTRLFARPAATADDDCPRIAGKFHDFVVPTCYPYEVLDHCNGLVLCRSLASCVMFVCNPAVRWWAYPAGAIRRRLVAVSWVPRPDPEEADDSLMPWPPSPWKWHEFSSRTRRWTEKVFVREGEAVGTVEALLWNYHLRYASMEAPWRYAAYWQGWFGSPLPPRYFGQFPAPAAHGGNFHGPLIRCIWQPATRGSLARGSPFSLGK
ncbi:hypothetical protein U9M48_004371 [Paspalum notatum var. saurae]|uniref:Uncharacterized protein n=1 Tax=Paspalum notatum var. saurae TaxID=547442 RepID=A0AAQ3PKE7_PASNO